MAYRKELAQLANYTPGNKNSADDNQNSLNSFADNMLNVLDKDLSEYSKGDLYACNSPNYRFNSIINWIIPKMELQSSMGICSLWYIDNLTDHPLDLVVVGYNIDCVSSSLISSFY